MSAHFAASVDPKTTRLALKDRRVVITGGSRGLGLAMARAMIARGAGVTVIARNCDRLAAAWDAGASAVAGDATDASLITRVVAEIQPDVLILNAGAQLSMLPIDRQTWDDFSSTWNTDVKAGLIGIQAALNVPMRPGGRVFLMSSGAAMVMSMPSIDPASLRLSGGYVGAKRMLWYMAHQANTVSRERGLNLRFHALVPGQVIPDTELGHRVAAAYAQVEGVTPEEHVRRRYGSILEPAQFAEMVADVVSDPARAGAVAYGFRADAGVMSLDVGVQPSVQSRD